MEFRHRTAINLDLEAVGEVAASLNRYEFLLTAAPLPTRGTGSAYQPDRHFLIVRAPTAQTSTAMPPAPVTRFTTWRGEVAGDFRGLRDQLAARVVSSRGRPP
ncbi:MAG: hypothetical protein F4X11_03680 [Acidobacteria bacterium]|nr:hypothetical protein [Acidobacteriota bacterium]